MSSKRATLGGVDAHGLVNLIRWAPPSDVVERSGGGDPRYTVTTGRHYITAGQSSRNGQSVYSVHYKKSKLFGSDWETVFRLDGDTSVSARAIFEALEARSVAQGRPQFVPAKPELNRREIVMERAARKLG